MVFITELKKGWILSSCFKSLLFSRPFYKNLKNKLHKTFFNCCLIWMWNLNFHRKVKVKQSHYGPGQAQMFPGDLGSQISRQSTYEVGKVVSRKHLPPFPNEIFLELIAVRSWVKPRAVVRPEGLCKWKIPLTTSVIEPATFRIVTQCLNQLRHSVLRSFFVWEGSLLKILEFRV